MTAIPRADSELADKNGRPGREFYSWFKTLEAERAAAVVTDATTAADLTALEASIAALEAGHTGDELLAAMYGTNGITVHGSIDAGVEIRGNASSPLESQIFGA